MQTSHISEKRISMIEAVRELKVDYCKHGMKGLCRGSGIGVLKAIISLTSFHEGRQFCTDRWKKYNQKEDESTLLNKNTFKSSK